MKIGLGTVQFGQAYGLTNKSGQTPSNAVASILAYARQNDIQYVDTAPLYGESEEVLGQTMDSEFKIVTKTMKFKELDEETAVALLEKTFAQSLRKLKRDSVYGLLFHDADDLNLSVGKVLFKKAEDFRARGLVRKIGVSVYSSEQIDTVCEKFTIDLIQLPFNVFDQRLKQSGHLKKLKDKGVEIHARSLFLQGLLLTEPDHLNSYFSPIKKHVESYQSLCKEKGISLLHAAVTSAMQTEELDVGICGVNNLEQLKEIVTVAKTAKPIAELRDFSLQDVKYINPALWRLA